LEIEAKKSAFLNPCEPYVNQRRGFHHREARHRVRSSLLQGGAARPPPRSLAARSSAAACPFSPGWCRSETIQLELSRRCTGSDKRRAAF
jgi:hypothetical protein